MGLISNLRETINRIRVVPKETAEDKTTFAKEEDSATQSIRKALSSGKRIDLSDIENVRLLKGTRNQKYTVFEEMVADGRIGAAIEMYANDAVQFDSKGNILWVESDDSDVARYCEKLISDLNIEQNLWSWAYCLLLYGDVFLETFMNTSESKDKPTLLLEPVTYNQSVNVQTPIPGAKLERYIEKVANSANIFDLQSKGKTCGYIRLNDEDMNNFTSNNNVYMFSGYTTNVQILSPTKFIHMCLSPNINRFPEKFQLIKDETLKRKKDKKGRIDGSAEGTGTEGGLTFQVKTGESILENVYSSYQTLKLKEDSVLLERITKSSIIRVIQVELGEMPESQKAQKLMELKQEIEQQMIMDKDAGSIQSRAGAQPTENIIYTSTKDGKGTISTVNIGGDAEIGNIDDINQSENKLFGSLLTPKAALGADMDGTGLSNGGSLTELNTTYARRIKRVQVALISGIRDLINIFALSDGVKNVVNNFSVKLTPIITVEDNRRDELMQTKVRNVDDIMSLLDKIKDENLVDDKLKLDMLVDFLGKYLNQQDIVDLINERLKQYEDNEEDKDTIPNEDNEEDMNNDFDVDVDINAPSHSFDNDFEPNFNDVPEREPEEPETQEPEATPEIPEQQDLADIEGEDLL